MNYPVTTLDQLRPILIGFRKSRGLTQAALAARLGVAQQTYAQLEANPGTASVERLFRLLRVLGVELVLADTETEQQVAPAAERYAVAISRSSGTQALAVKEKTPASVTASSAKAPTKPRKREAW